MLPRPDFELRVAAMRRFARFYTREIGLLQGSLLDTPFSLTQARVLYELAHGDAVTASDLAGALGIDHGYLSRILRSFAEDGLIDRVRAAHDARQVRLALTMKGRKAFAVLDSQSQRETGALLARLPEEDQNRIVAAMSSIESLIGGQRAPAAFGLRSHRPGDMGWVVSSHGALYAREYGWDISFEALVAEIVAQFIKNFDPQCEHCWIAELDGEPAGSVFLVKESAAVARLRLLLVEPRARGLGMGRRLVDECIGFARRKGYSKITLWTQSILTQARAIYGHAGFVLVGTQPHRSFGADLVGETWELTL